jgi:hypothetical protein
LFEEPIKNVTNYNSTAHLTKLQTFGQLISVSGKLISQEKETQFFFAMASQKWRIFFVGVGFQLKAEPSRISFVSKLLSSAFPIKFQRKVPKSVNFGKV